MWSIEEEHNWTTFLWVYQIPENMVNYRLNYAGVRKDVREEMGLWV